MSKLPPHLQTTLDTLRTHATDGECQMSLAELAHARGVTDRTMHNHIHQLKVNGHLTIHYRPGKSSIYHLVNPAPGSGWRLGQRWRGIMDFLQRLGLQPSSTDDQPTANPALNRSKGTTLIGRADILTALHENTAKRRHTLLVGPLGIGKSHILRHFATNLEQGSQSPERSEGTGTRESRSANLQSEIYNLKSIRLDHVSPIKPALLTLAQRLHADGNLAVAGIEANYMEWEDVRKKIAPLRVNQLADLVVKCLAPRAERTEGMTDRNYILLLDHLERVTPTMLPHLDALMDVAVVIAATDELKPSAQRLWWAFERVEVPPLPRHQARELLWQVADRDRVARPQLFETRVLQQAGGNPLAIVTMAGKAAPRGTDRRDHTAALSAQEIRGLRHGAGVRYISLTPALMLIGALIVAARFVALGLNDRDLYVLAGLGYASFFFMRYFIYRID